MPGTTMFLSYSSQDRFFAALAETKLAEADIQLWRDQRQLRAGTDWRHEIEVGITKSDAVLVALSKNSVESTYVTYEWAYALGNAKTVIPIKLEDCSVHPRLAAIQFLDFSTPHPLAWQSLIDQIKDVETDSETNPSAIEKINMKADPKIKQILSYLDQKGYQMASFDRIRRRIDDKMTNEDLEKFIKENNDIFRKATLRGGKPGLAKLIP